MHAEGYGAINGVLESPKRQNDVLETSEMLTEKLTLKEMDVIRLITTDPKISIASITNKTELSRRTVDRIIATLKEKNLLTRQGSKNNEHGLHSFHTNKTMLHYNSQRFHVELPHLDNFMTAGRARRSLTTISDIFL